MSQFLDYCIDESKSRFIERVTCFETSWWSIDVFPGITDRLLDSRFPRAVLPEDQKWGPGTQDQIRHSLPRIHPWSIRFQLQQVLIWMDRTDFEPIKPVFCTWQFLMLIFTWHHCIQITVYALCKITFRQTKFNVSIPGLDFVFLYCTTLPRPYSTPAVFFPTLTSNRGPLHSTTCTSSCLSSSGRVNFTRCLVPLTFLCENYWGLT